MLGKTWIENLDGCVGITLVRLELKGLRGGASWQGYRGRRGAGSGKYTSAGHGHRLSSLLSRGRLPISRRCRFAKG
jgi:hypothetical protein